MMSINPTGAAKPYASPESTLLETIGLPRSTYAAVKAAGRGPKTFKIGRRIYVLHSEWYAWLDRCSREGVVPANEQRTTNSPSKQTEAA